MLFAILKTEESAEPFASSIDKESVNKLPIFRYTGPTELVSEDRKLSQAIEELAEEEVLGFDTETRPVFHKGYSRNPALLQLAGKNRVYLFQLKILPRLDGLFDLLANANVLKVGVAIRDDLIGLKKWRPFTQQGYVELSSVTKKHGVTHTGLRNLTAIFLKIRISKGARMSNWERNPLSTRQMEYAATDAWVARELFLRFRELNLLEETEAEMARP